MRRGGALPAPVRRRYDADPALERAAQRGFRAVADPARDLGEARARVAEHRRGEVMPWTEHRGLVLIRLDPERILTCCLDYGTDRVVVTDIVQQKSAEVWRLMASEYPKLRLPRELVTHLPKAERRETSAFGVEGRTHRQRREAMTRARRASRDTNTQWCYPTATSDCLRGTKKANRVAAGARARSVVDSSIVRNLSNAPTP